jgi:hypothetical protein
MKTMLTLAVLLSITACTRKAPEPTQIARIMPNGPDAAAAQAKCAVVSDSADVVASCARALRADVCGSGETHTVEGVLVEVIVGGRDIQDAEAVWTPGKATCVGLHTRPQIHQAAKACGVPVQANCGIGPQMLVTRLPAGG